VSAAVAACRATIGRRWCCAAAEPTGDRVAAITDAAARGDSGRECARVRDGGERRLRCAARWDAALDSGRDRGGLSLSRGEAADGAMLPAGNRAGLWRRAHVGPRLDGTAAAR